MKKQKKGCDLRSCKKHNQREKAKSSIAMLSLGEREGSMGREDFLPSF
jgi:hypothetical protein